MEKTTLKRTIAETFAYVREWFPHKKVDFIWHGGEPMLAGRQFFEAAVEFQRSHCGSIQYRNAIQTNGTLIDEKWAVFFKKEDFGVSISLDGPPDVHDLFRKNQRGEGSFHTARRAIEITRAAKIPVGICAVISRANVSRASELYDYFAREQLPFNPIPLTRSGSARDKYLDIGLGPSDYAGAWITMYDRWFDAEEDYVYCSDFVNKTRAVLGRRPMDCVGLAQCSTANISVDPLGDVYPCASLSGNTAANYGNLMQLTLSEIMTSVVATEYATREHASQCNACRWGHICHGGCQARAWSFFGNKNRRDYFCPSLFRIYEHIDTRLRECSCRPTQTESSNTPAEPNCIERWHS